MRILIVDDSYVTRTQIKSLLSGYGDCDTAPNGEIALQLLRIAYQEAVPYDLVSLDYEMPGMHGREVIAEIRKWERIHSVPSERSVKILVVSAREDGNIVTASFRPGCEGYLLKPVTRAKLEQAFSQFGLAPGAQCAGSAGS